ncbi:MAG: response regulator [Cyanobacteria bacterium Co-bin13]|nr:response regulator [Cyanobacteria bacterium Co-bin13]
MKRSLWIDTLQWFIGIYLAVRGTLMLMVPHNLSTHVFVPIQAHLPWLGSWQVIAGAALITAVTLLPHRPVIVFAHVLAGSALLQAAGGHLLAGTWTALVDFGILGIGTTLAPFLQSRWRLLTKRGVDLFALLMGIRMMLDGIIVLLPFNPQFGAHLYDPVRPYLLAYGTAYLISGLALLLVYFIPQTPRWLFWVAHVAAGGVLWSWTLGLGFPTWNSVLFYGGLGTLLALLPWLSKALRRLDPSTLRTQLAVILVGIVTLPLLFAVMLVTLPQEQTIINQALALQQTLAVTLSQDLATYVSLHRAAVQALAKQPNLAALPPQEQRSLLRQINQEYSDVIVLTTFDAEGNAIARSDDRPLSPSIATLNSYKAAKLLGEPTLNIRIGRVIQRPIFTFTAPLYDSNREFAGVVAGAIEASRVIEHLVENGGRTGIQAYLVDDQGRVIAHPDTSLVEAFTDYSKVPPVAALLTPDALPGGLQYWYEAAWHLAGYAQVPRLGWGIVVDRPAADALQALNIRRNRDFEVLFTVAAIALVIGLLLARRLTRPLLALAYATDRLAAGDAQAPLPRSSIQEVAHLATTFGAMRDRLITRTAERDRAEFELRQSEAKIRRLVESNVIGVILADMNGTVLEANDAFLKMVGYSREDLQANRVRWREMTPPEFAEVSQRSVEELRTQGVCTPFEKEYIRKDGSRVPILLGSALIEETQNQVIGFVLDLSDRKQMERERELLLHRERVAREEAESANRIKDEFLAVLSHELRSPLNPILGWAKLLLSRTVEPNTLKKALSTIERNARLQSQLIEDLLDVSRILRGKMSLSMTPLLLSAIIKEALETVQAAATAKAIAIETEIDPAVGPVLGDAARLQQIVWNLLSNAVKFTDAGGRVEVRLEGVGSQGQGAGLADSTLASDRQTPPPQFARITVTDTGKGIRPDFLPYVFDYFRQADSTTTRRFGGLGLGLAIVRNLVELHGGTVWVDSAGEGKGAAFTVQLPLLRHPVSARNAGKTQIDPASATACLRGICALVVDDETDSRDFASFVLQQAGAKVTTAASAQEALAVLAQTRPDILLSDIGMPEMNGYGLIEQVRSQEATQQKPFLPAIALTAYASENDLKQALAAGFQQHLPKPVDPEALVQAVLCLVQSSFL